MAPVRILFRVISRSTCDCCIDITENLVVIKKVPTLTSKKIVTSCDVTVVGGRALGTIMSSSRKGRLTESSNFRSL